MPSKDADPPKQKPKKKKRRAPKPPDKNKPDIFDEIDKMKSNTITKIEYIPSNPHVPNTKSKPKIYAAQSSTAKGNHEIVYNDNFLFSKSQAWTLAVITMLVYMPCAGTLTSFQVIVPHLLELEGIYINNDESNSNQTFSCVNQSSSSADLDLSEIPMSSDTCESIYASANWKISTLNSLCFGLTVGLCPFSSWLASKLKSYRTVILIGLSGVVVGTLLTSVMSNLWAMYLTYSIIFGISNNCVYNGLISLVGSIFTKVESKSVASSTALTATSISLGTVTFNYLGNLVVQQDESYGFFWRFLMHSLWTLAMLVLFYFTSYKFKDFSPLVKDEDASHSHGTGNENLSPSCKGTQTSRQASRQALEKSPSTIGADANWLKNKLLIVESVPSMLTSQRSLTTAFYCWMVSTFIWSMTYTIPYSNAANWPEYRTTSSKKELTLNMTIFGVCELVSRVLQIWFAKLVPDRKFAVTFSVFTFLSGLSVILLLFNHSVSRLLFFVIFPLTTGPLNGLLYGATQDIFGVRKIVKFWPIINVFLALGFFLGPVLASLMVSPLDRIASTILLFIAALLQLAVNYQLKTEIEKLNYQRQSNTLNQLRNDKDKRTIGINIDQSKDTLVNTAGLPIGHMIETTEVNVIFNCNDQSQIREDNSFKETSIITIKYNENDNWNDDMDDGVINKESDNEFV